MGRGRPVGKKDAIKRSTKKPTTSHKRSIGIGVAAAAEKKRKTRDAQKQKEDEVSRTQHARFWKRTKKETNNVATLPDTNSDHGTESDDNAEEDRSSSESEYFSCYEDQEEYESYHTPQNVEENIDEDPSDKTPHHGDFGAEDGCEDEPVMLLYRKAVQKRLQAELATQGKNMLKALERKWLLEYLKVHNWTIHDYDAEYICKMLNQKSKVITFDEKWYYRTIYVWLPDVRWGKECTPVCPRCDSNKDVSFHCWRDNHFGRKIISLDTNYFIMSRRYICKKCKDDYVKLTDELKQRAEDAQVDINLKEEKEKIEFNYTFMAWNERCLQRLPCGYGTKFPALLSWKSGVDKMIVDMMRPLCNSGFRGESFANMLKELHTKRHANDFIEREKINEKFRLLEQDMPYKGLFSDFGDKTKYNGTLPTGAYLYQMYKQNHKSFARHMDLEVKKRECTEIHMDVSCKEALNLFRYEGVSIFKGLCTVCNQIGEIRLQFHLYTDGHDQYRAAFEAFKNTAKEYGQGHVTLAFTDNPRRDKAFLLNMFPSLRHSEKMFNAGNYDITDNANNYTIEASQVKYVKTEADMNAQALAIQTYMENDTTKMLGLDAEWNVRRNPFTGNICGKEGKVATIQIAYKDRDGIFCCVIFHVARAADKLPSKLIDLITDTSLTFVGVHISGDIKGIAGDFNRRDIAKDCKRINLGSYCRMRNLISNGKLGLEAMSKEVLNRVVVKDETKRFSDWNANNLTWPQKEYAAIDAIASLDIGIHATNYPDLSIRLKQSEVKDDLAVDIVPSKGNVAVMLSRAAIGKIVSASKVISYPKSIECNLTKRQRNRIAVKVEKVLAPGLLVPSYSVSNDGRQASLSDFGTAPFTVLLPLRMLKNHDPREHIPIWEDDTPVPLDRNNDNGRFQTEPSSSTGDIDEEVKENENENEDDDLEQIFNATTKPQEIDEIANEISESLTDADIDCLRSIRKTMENVTAQTNEVPVNDFPMKHKKLEDPPLIIRNWFSSVLADGWHLQDGIKKPRRHDILKLFSVSYQDALYAWDEKELKKLKVVMIEIDGLSEEEIERMMYYNVRFFQKCIERRILPPAILYYRVRAVFIVYGDVVDSTTGRPLFNDKAWKRANNVLKLILDGLISDPPGISLYSIALHEDGSPKTNKYGFHILHCHRGTSGVENIHKNIHQIWSSWHMGVEMSDCLLREFRHRHNHNVSVKKRLGYPDIGHYDTWKVDEIQNLVEQNHSILVYPNWSNASDMRQTKESLGTVPLHNKTLEEEMASITLSDDVKFNGTLQYLKDAMNVKCPFLPVLKDEEKQLFSRLMLEHGEKIDENKMAREWCKYVDGKDIFPKLPTHLRTYFNQYEKRHNIKKFERATATLRRRLEVVNEIFNESEVAVEESTTMESDDVSTRQHVHVKPRPTMPVSLPPITQEMLHSRASTVIGSSIIYHTQEATLTNLVEKPKQKGQRGKDKKRRKRAVRTCSECGSYECNGRWPTAKCNKK